MGTGIVAIAAATLPFRIAGLHMFALAVWVPAAGWLVVLCAAWAVHWTRHADRARGHAGNPVMAQFWGAPAMALMTVGAGTPLLGRGWLGLTAAVDADWVLWGLGTGLGLVTACWIPYLMMTRHEIAPDGAFGGWLMPVVPPMVSAATGALLVPLYGVPAWGFAMAWLAIAGCTTLRALRNGLPFGLTWWSFTFPVGTCVTGTIGLAARTGLDLLRGASATLFLLLLIAWLIVAARTVHYSARGLLFLPAGAPQPTAAGELADYE